MRFIKASAITPRLLFFVEVGDAAVLYSTKSPKKR